MTEDQNHAAVLAVLVEHGVTAAGIDLDTLATRIVAAFNNPAQPTASADAATGSTEPADDEPTE